jgi:hypothetical protein
MFYVIDFLNVKMSMLVSVDAMSNKSFVNFSLLD